MTKTRQKSPQSIETKRVTKSSTNIEIFNREVRYLKVKDVRRAYSKLIQNFCKGLVPNEDARVLVYMFNGYLQLIRDTEFEERLLKLEKNIKEKDNRDEKHL